MSAFTLLFTRQPNIGSANSWQFLAVSCRFLPFLAVLRETIGAKRNRANHSSLSGKRFDATEDRGLTDQLMLFSRTPRSCIRNETQENLLKSTKIVLALPSYNRQRLSGIRRGWCPSQVDEELKG
jgi:hypothetical protein